MNERQIVSWKSGLLGSVGREKKGRIIAGEEESVEDKMAMGEEEGMDEESKGRGN